MSRIEKALEKALQQRQENTSVQHAEVVQPENTFFTGSVLGAYPHQIPKIPITNPLLVAVTDPFSQVAEEYRKLKSSLVSAGGQNPIPKLLMVTSAIAGEGKSLTALNLALSLAQEKDLTVLLIDADLRKPSIAGYLGVDDRAGLAELLEERVDVGNVLMHTGAGKLAILPAGRVTHNPVELFSSNLMAELLKEIKNRYPDRIVIIDTPPILPFAETRILSRLVDGVVFVVKERLTTNQNLTEAMSAIDSARILGIVYNEAENSPGSDKYGHYYSRSGYYRKGSPTGQHTTESR